MSARWVKLTAFLMAVLMPSAMMSADMVGVVRVSGNDVTLDGRACDSGVVGFDGELLSTGADSKATVTSRGTTISMATNSSVKLGTKALELIVGSVVVSSDTGSSTHVEDVIISTAPGMRAKFVAQRTDDELQVVALEGSVEVSDGQQTTTVPAVSGGKIGLGKGSNDKGQKHKKFAWLKNDDIGLIILVGAAVTAGVALGLVNSGNKKTSVSAP
ncbi:MAG TPA: hypothetical protein VFI82_04965 [Terriglobales bacterium]|jgi:hypothetical protein|nr:hypothetical protein [Terriglobales bacterium]